MTVQAFDDLNPTFGGSDFSYVQMLCTSPCFTSQSCKELWTRQVLAFVFQSSY